MSKSKINKWRIFHGLTNVFVVLMAVYLILCSKYESITSVKTDLFYIICGGFAGCCLLLSLETVLVGTVEPKEMLKKLVPDSMIQILMLSYLLFSLVSSILSGYSSVWTGLDRREGFLTIAIYVLCFYFVSKFVKPQKWMMYVFGCAVTVFCVVSVIQFFGSGYLYPDGMNYYDAYVEYSGAYIGTVGNVDYAAAFLTLCLPAFSLYVVKAEEKMRFLLLIPAVLAAVVMLKIWVLAGIVGILAAVVVIVPPLFKLKRRGNIVYFTSLVCIGAGVLTVLYAVPFKGGLLSELHSILHGNISETFGSGRIHIWSEVISKVPDNLFFGTGPDTMLYAEIEPFRRVDDVYGEIVALIDTAHNEYLNVLFHQGIFAAISFAGAAVMIVVKFIKNASKSKGVLILGAALIGYLACAVFGISNLITAPFFWLCLGFFDHITVKKEKNNE